MKNYKNLNIKGTMLDKNQLENYLEKVASDHVLQNKSSKDTYPIPKLKENFEAIEEVYNLLNENIKLGIPIHPAGEWLLDNFYMIEETVKMVIKEMPMSKYTKFLGISNGIYKGFARIYVLAAEIVAYTDNRIDKDVTSNLICAYQRKKSLSMEEIWNIGIFMQIALIQNIKDICEKIYFSQMQKYRVENIIERLVENKEDLKYKNLGEYKQRVKGYGEMKYPFIEYMSYRLKKYGKSAYSFTNCLEEQVNKMGTSIEDVIKKEHFDIAVKKVSMANSIKSIKELLRMDFLEIFEKINGVEKILKNDPAGIYSKMDYKTKEYYRVNIKELSQKTKISEIYIANKLLQIAEKGNTLKEKHVGYYLIDKGREKLLEELQVKENKIKNKEKLYISSIWIITILLTLIVSVSVYISSKNLLLSIILGILLILPFEQISVQIINYILGKVVKPKLVPKMDMQENGVPEESSTFVVIPTIIKSKEKVQELMKKLEVYYLANKSENIYFALLGDCSSGENKEELFDIEVMEEGIKQAKKLNEKYPNKEGEIPKFTFIYRKRFWNGKEECYLGWERKRGLLNQFNEYILGNEENVFRVNTLEDWKKEAGKDRKIKDIKYVITLDSDTELVLNTGLELIGAMSHVLNTPVLSQKRDVVIDGHALIQPRVGINLDSSRKTKFTKIFAGNGGTDLYANAISDIYQDNFGEGIFTGKGIYDLKVFSEILKNEIAEDTVLSHDLLEGSYLRCALATDIMLMDGYPTNYKSFKKRLHRWTRGDFQIYYWIRKYIVDRMQNKKINPLNLLSKYKIFDNLIRAIYPISVMLCFIIACIWHSFEKFNIALVISSLIISVLMPTIISLLDRIIFKKDGEKKQKSFSNKVSSTNATLLRGLIAIAVLPDKAYMMLDAIIRTVYRMRVSKKHLLEWTTAEDAEKQSKNDLKSYYEDMLPNVVIGILALIYSYIHIESGLGIVILVLSIIWLATPLVLWYIGKREKENLQIEELNKEDKEYVLELGKKTWEFFKNYLTEENNYLPPDNYQEDRNPKVVGRTSSTNIGLALLAVVSSYDLGYETLPDTLELLNKMVTTIESLPKWHGHLYNWYNIKTLEPLIPRYISTVDSGNFVSYVYVLKQFYIEIREKIIEQNDKETNKLLELIPFWVDLPINEIPIAKADFTKLYDEEKRLFSIGFNIEENKLTDSYYDLLASEARGTSFVAIAKRDVSSKHWYNLNRTLTILDGYKGLLSWSGTAFEYLMPNVNMKKYEGSLLDESCKFMLENQKQYANKIGIPWGFSETAFNVKDLNNNYQYKAIGIPWLGLKRGLEDDIVIATYASVLAITEEAKEVVENLKRLEKQEMYGKYGFYESIDYTPMRLARGKKYETVKTYMSHHQALILLSINNLFSKNVLVKRFNMNPEIEALDILLQEKMPENMIITKEEKSKPSKIKYVDYENYAQRNISKINENLRTINAISNDKYLIVMDEKGNGYSKYKDIIINRYKETSEEEQGIFFYIKNIKNKRIWTSNYMNYLSKPDKYDVTFAEDVSKISRIDGAIETTTKVTVAQDEAVEIRNVEIKNNGLEEETLEVTATLEPVISKAIQDYAHLAFNNLFLIYKYIEEDGTILVKRKARQNNEKNIYLAVCMQTESNTIGELEYEIDKEKFVGRGNFKIPNMVENSKPFSKSTNLVTDPIIAMKRTIKIKPEERANLSLVIAIGEKEDDVLKTVKAYSNNEKIKKTFELSKARVEAEARYLEINNKQIETYQKMLAYVLFQNPLKKLYIKNLPDKKYPQSELWKYGISGDLPIILVKMKQINDVYVLEDILKAYEYYRAKNIEVDLVILDEEINSYEKYVKEGIINQILNKNLSYMQNVRGGIFLLEDVEDINLFEYRASLVLDAQKGHLARQLKDMEDEYLESIEQIGYEKPSEIYDTEEKIVQEIDTEKLKYYNEYGGFSEDGKEYIMKINRDNRLPTTWSNICANEKFGTLVTESLGGYTWSENSRLNRITAWSNNQVTDTPSEIIYMQDKKTGKTWSLGVNPMPDNSDYVVTYGLGYAKYKHTSMGVIQELDTFVAKEDSVKINLLNLKNLAPKKKKLKLVYYIKPVIGEDELLSKGCIELEQKNNTVIAKNNANENEEYIYVSSNEKIKSYTASKAFFIGKGTIANPEGLKKVELDNESGEGTNSIIAIEIEVELEAFENKDISFILGAQKSVLECQDSSYKYSKIQACVNEYENVKRYWRELVDKVQVNTPVESFNILINGWLCYQTIVSRLWGRTGFYQSGGAFGFRDQLQDTLGLKYYSPEFMKKQIIKHSRHQFIEGDVEHWWHEETSRGIRTRFSDDLLWLVYAVIEYINTTGDYSILDEVTQYREGEILEENVDEKYDFYPESAYKEDIYHHCLKAIEKSLNFGENGLPKIGSGDWNDGMSTVGNKGKGESVWLGFFLYDVLTRFLPIIEQRERRNSNK